MTLPQGGGSCAESIARAQETESEGGQPASTSGGAGSVVEAGRDTMRSRTTKHNSEAAPALMRVLLLTIGHKGCPGQQACHRFQHRRGV